MKQYCRYCAYCFDAGDDFRCSNHPRGEEPHWSRAQINRENNCPNYVLSDLGDAETGKQYAPRETVKKQGEQTMMEGLDDNG